jgi:DNA-binding CsgD family transcriptional regulator
MKTWSAKNPFWFGENGRRAETMWAKRNTFKQIAETLGTTRSAVASYIRRKGLVRGKGVMPRPKDENGWKIPAPGTMSRRVYDLAITGKPAREIADETGLAIGTVTGVIAQLRPPKPREEPPPLPDIPEPKMTDVEYATTLENDELEKIITSLNSLVNKERPLPRALEELRQYLLHERLVRDFRTFIKRFEPDRGHEMIWSSFVEGLENYRKDIEEKTGRPLVIPTREGKAIDR